MGYNTVIVDQENHVGTITLNRPEQLNTFSSEMAKELNQALIQLDNDKEVRVVVVKGAGRLSPLVSMWQNFLENP